MPNASESYYDLLEIPSTATAEEIKRAYRRQAMILHPDQNPSEEANLLFAAVNHAYQVLGDPLRRRAYDMQRSMQQTIREPRPWAPPSSAWESPPPPGETESTQAQTEFTEAYWRAKAAQTRRRREEYGTYTPFFRWVALALIGVSLLLGVEYLLQQRKGPMTIEAVASTVHHGVGMTKVVTDQGNLVLRGEMLALLEPGDQLFCWQTPILGLDVQVQVVLNRSPQRQRRLPSLVRKFNLPSLNAPFHPRPGIFNLFSPVWLIMTLVAAITLLIPRRLPERIFQAGLFMSFFGFLTIFLTVIS
jgi:hypothetical protein